MGKALKKGKGKGRGNNGKGLKKGAAPHSPPSSNNSSSEKEVTWTWKKDRTGIVGIKPFRVKLREKSLEKDQDKRKAVAKATHIAIDWCLAPGEAIEAVELLLEKRIQVAPAVVCMMFQGLRFRLLSIVTCLS